MKRIVSDDRVYEYVCERLGVRLLRPYTCLGIEQDGEIVAGFVFNDFSEFALEISIAGDTGAWTRAFLRRVADYVFRELDLLRISITTEQQHVIDLAIRLGAQIEGRKRNHFGKGRDGIILGILREEWKIK